MSLNINQILINKEKKKIVCFNHDLLKQMNVFKYIGGDSLVYNNFSIYDQNGNNYAQIYNNLGSLTITANLFNIQAPIVINNDVTFSYNISSSSLHVSHDLNVSGNLTVSNNSIFYSDVTVLGTLNFSGGLGYDDLKITDNSTFGNWISTSGLRVSQNVSIRGDLSVSSNTTISNLLSISGLLVSQNANITGTLSVGNNMNLSGILYQNGYNMFPAGTILMWFGTETNVPSGWAICDGRTLLGYLTPDLRGRFVLGSGQGSGLTNRIPGQTGGLESVTLNTNQIPSHNHTGTTNIDGTHNHTASSNITGGHQHEYEDAYFAEANSTTQNNVFGTSAGTDNDNEFIWRTRENTAVVSGQAYNKPLTESSGAHSHTIIIDNNGAHTHVFTTNSTGGNNSHENMPPFYVLVYIMKCF